MKKPLTLLITITVLATAFAFPIPAYAFTPDPQTAYAREFIEKCDGQQWFIDEVERMLNVQEKTLDTIKSRADFEYIITFGLRNKVLEGVIPRAFGELYNLRDIFLSENNLTGNIPAEVFTLSKLENLDLSNNQLSGTISPDISHLTALKILLLWNNDFSGNIPAEIGSMTSLINLDLAENQLTGQIPDTLGNLSNLNILALSNNPLDTVIPSTFGGLTSLRVLLAWKCGMKGTIPPELGNAINMQILDVANNSLTGGFPSTFGQLVNLEKLTARYNGLNAALPPEMGSMASLEILDFPYNTVPGIIPSTFGNLSNLIEFIANDNVLSGELPLELGQLDKLEKLILSDNRLEGAIPSEFGGLVSVINFELARNRLTGVIPQELEDMTETETFLVNDNRLEGKIPPIFDNWNNLASADLSNNTLVGDAPQALANKQKAGVDVNLKTNYLAGTVLKTMQNQDDNFIDGQASNILEHRLYVQEYLQMDIDQTGNIYTLFKHYDARTNRESAKPKLPVNRYSFVIVSGNPLAVELTQDAFGFYVKVLEEIKLATPVIIEITIIGDEGNPYPATRVKIVTEKPPVYSSGGGGGGGGGSSAPAVIPQVLQHEGYILGYDDGTVRPDGNITRAELAMVLYRTYDDQAKDASVFKVNPFPDVKLNEWYGFAVSYIKQKGLMQGDPDGSFRPEDELTRAEFAATIARLKKLELKTGAAFPDILEHWANTYITSVNDAGYMVGYPDETFKPENNITRAEVMTAMNRLFGRKPDKTDILAKTENPYSDLTVEHWAYEHVMEASIQNGFTTPSVIY